LHQKDQNPKISQLPDYLMICLFHHRLPEGETTSKLKAITISMITLLIRSTSRFKIKRVDLDLLCLLMAL